LASKKYPTKADLDAAFPDIPVVLNRVDGHAIIVNSKALQMAGITKNTNADGGQMKLQMESQRNFSG
jgi:predicted amidohydrolase YtcJ